MQPLLLMSLDFRWIFRRGIAAALLGALLPPVVASTAAAQARLPQTVLAAPELRGSPVLERAGHVVVIDLDENRLYFLQGRTVLWSAPVGTGMGLRLEAGDRKWEFSTPTGVYQVQYKEENPVWYAPDWYYVENKLPVPPPNSPQRRMTGVLGVAAVYIGAGLAIHGTDKPDLLGQRVSHGCIRLANEYAQRLYHNVQIGTKVVIVGGEHLDEEPGQLIPGQVPGAGPVDARTQRLRDRAKQQRAQLLERLGAMSTDELADGLTEALARRPEPETAAEWPELASVLLRRAVKDRDVEAAQALFEAAGSARDRRVRAEYATFLVDLYSRGGPTAARALARLDEPGRSTAAGALVEAALALYGGDAADPAVPWPTRRLLREVLERDALPGWDALHAAEQRVRERHGIRPAPPEVVEVR